MTMRKIYDLAVKTGEYTNQYGETKGRWTNVGRVMQDDNGGKFILLNRTFNPAGVEVQPGRDSVALSMFPPKEQNGGNDGGGNHGGGNAPRQNNGGGNNTNWDPMAGHSGGEADIPF